MRYDFSTIKFSTTRNGKCPVCGKRVTRSTTFEQTENPFNRNADGEPKSRSEIWDDLKQEARDWVPDFTHARCQEDQ